MPTCWHISVSMRCAELQNSNIYPALSPNDFLYYFSIYFVRSLKLLFNQRQTGYLFIHSLLIPGYTFRSVYTNITTVGQSILIMFKRLALGLLAAQSVAAMHFAMYIDELVETRRMNIHIAELTANVYPGTIQLLFRARRGLRALTTQS